MCKSDIDPESAEAGVPVSEDAVPEKSILALDKRRGSRVQWGSQVLNLSLKRP